MDFEKYNSYLYCRRNSTVVVLRFDVWNEYSNVQIVDFRAQI